MFQCVLFVWFIFEVQCIKQVAKLVVSPPVVMGYDDRDDHEFIISDEEKTPDEIKRPAITYVFNNEVKSSPVTRVTKATTSNPLQTTLSPSKNHEEFNTSITDKDTKISPPDSYGDGDSNDNGDGIKSDDVLANSELLSSTSPATKEKEELDKSRPSLEQDVTSQQELHVDSKETQESDGIKSDDVIANPELLSSTSTITKEKKEIDKSPPSHEQDVTSQEQVHVDKEKTQVQEHTKKEDVVQKEHPEDYEDHKKTIHTSVSTESEKPVPVARKYLVNGFI